MPFALVDAPPAIARAARQPRFIELHREDAAADRAALVAGLLAPVPRLSPKYFYDAIGSRLFEAITDLPEYYPTRTEAAIFAAQAHAMAGAIGPVGSLVDLGAGNCLKAQGLFPALRPRRYVAVDISVDFLREALQRVQQAAPQVEVVGVGTDFSASLELPRDVLAGRPVFFYPGSSIGNFSREEALRLLGEVRAACAAAGGGGLLIGVDLVKDERELVAAYDDAVGVTAAFNLNALRHVNRLIGADFDPRRWRHEARWNAPQSRVEMHLVAREAQAVHWDGGSRDFEAGAGIHTENACKWTLDGFAALLADAGLRGARHWTDAERRYAVFWAAA